MRSAANLVGTTLETANVLQAAKRKDEFLAVLGHELRNPLAPILTAVDLDSAIELTTHVITRYDHALVRARCPT